MTPGFFKLLKNPSRKSLVLPPSIKVSYMPTSVPITIICSDGKSWVVYVRRIKKKLCIYKGWEEFCSANSLEFADFLQFQPVGDLRFSFTRAPFELTAESPPIFHVILFHPEEQQLRLPKQFSTFHLRNFLVNQSKWYHVYGTNSKIWRLKIEVIDGVHVFSDGWHTILHDMKLKEMDFLIFKMINSETFRMFAYFPNGLEMIYVKDESDANGGVISSLEGNNPNPVISHQQNACHPSIDSVPYSFTKTIENRMRLPSLLVKKANLVVHRQLIVRNDHGQQTSMDVQEEKNGKHKRFKFAKWKDFIHGNNICIGDQYKFTFIMNERVLLMTKVS